MMAPAELSIIVESMNANAAIPAMPQAASTPESAMLARIDPTDIDRPRIGMLSPSYPNAIPPAMSPATMISTVASAE